MKTTVPWPQLIGIFLLSRLLVLIGLGLSYCKTAVMIAVGIFRWVFFMPDPGGKIACWHRLFLHSHVPSLEDIASYWDGFWYLRLAQDGYTFNGSVNHQTVAHYPFFSLICYLFSRPIALLGISNTSAILWTGIFLNNLLFLGSLVLLFLIVRRYHGELIALSAALLLALFPGSVYYSLFLTESFFLFFCLAFFYLLEEKRYWLAALVSWPAMLTRYNGLFLFVIMGYSLKKKNLLILGFMALGIALYPIYLGIVFHEPLLYVKLQAVYRGARSLGVPIVGLLTVLLFGVCTFLRRLKLHKPVMLLFLVLTAVYLGMSLWALLGKTTLHSAISLTEVTGMSASAFAVIVFALYRHKLPTQYQIFTALHLMAIFYAGTFASDHRYVAVIFPLFWMLALALGDHPILRKTCAAIFGVGLVVLTILYAAMAWSAIL